MKPEVYIWLLNASIMSFGTLLHVSSAMLGTGLASGWRREAGVWLDEKEKPCRIFRIRESIDLARAAEIDER
jgi:hypothetical protein